MKRRVRRLRAHVRRGLRGFARAIAGLLPRPTVRAVATPSDRPIERIVVFARLPNPTLDYYLAARLAAPGMPPARVVDIRDKAIETLEAAGTFVLVCRYASRRVVSWIDRHGPDLAGVGFFTDDDIGAVVTGADATLGYRLFLWRRGLAPLARLNRHVDHVWTATPALAEAIGGDGVRVLPPAPAPEIWRGEAPHRRDDTPLRIAYHATGVHLREHRFLVPVMTEVLRLRPNVVFEVTADDRARDLWKGIDRATVVAPTSWPAYLERTRRERADIVVVPLLRSRANRARAGTKRIDVVRLGAAGVFSASPAYGAPGDTDEVVLTNRRKIWIAAIVTLVDDPQARARAADATRRAVEAMAAEAALGIPELVARADRTLPAPAEEHPTHPLPIDAPAFA